jgi:hypothetical protein
MADASLQAALQALDVARYVGDVKRIAAAKLVLAQAVAAHKSPTESDHEECHQKLAAD